jgi:CelD/BcsL family acetyltransferase involved in cellulose biosynthesis
MLQLSHPNFSAVSRTISPDHMLAGLRIDVLSSLNNLREVWEDTQASGLCTVFQSYRWCHSWLQTIGSTSKISPAIVLGCLDTGAIAFILPLQIRRVGSFKVLEWLAQKDSNFGGGIISPSWAQTNWFSDHFQALLQLLPKFDVVNLQNCPDYIMGRSNSLFAVHKFTAANTSYSLELKSDYAELHMSKRSSKSISKIRRRDERLKDLGVIEITSEHSLQESKDLLHELYALKDQQLAKLGIGGIFEPARREFYDRLDQDGCLKLFRLSLDKKIIALVLGAVHGDVFHLMVTALSPIAPLAYSPGDMLLRHVIEWCCDNNIRIFDFSPGESEYKLLWASHRTKLSHQFAARNLRGLPLTLYLVATQSAKRVIKTHPLLWRGFTKLRYLRRSRAS